jgi:hypothetical protein
MSLYAKTISTENFTANKQIYQNLRYKIKTRNEA